MAHTIKDQNRYDEEDTRGTQHGGRSGPGRDRDRRPVDDDERPGRRASGGRDER